MIPPLPSIAETIRAHGLAARKSLGQHFLLDEQLCGKIARLAGDLDGRHVLEVGPGPGGLTRALLATAAASVTALEIDPRAVAALAALADRYPDRLRVLAQDALGSDIAALVPAPRHIVANLPYNVATPLLVGWLQRIAAFERLTLMFQLEVAERITAAPATSAYGRLSVLSQLTTRPAIVMRLSPGAFTPPPQVASAIVRFDPLPDQLEPALLRRIERLTQAAFGQRRKMLRSALKPLGGDALLAAAGIEPTRRAETLAPTEFRALADALSVTAQA